MVWIPTSLTCGPVTVPVPGPRGGHVGLAFLRRVWWEQCCEAQGIRGHGLGSTQSSQDTEQSELALGLGQGWAGQGLDEARRMVGPHGYRTDSHRPR